MCVRIASDVTMDAIHSISCSVYYHLIILCDRCIAHRIHHNLFLSYSDHIARLIFYKSTLTASRHTATITGCRRCPHSLLDAVIILDSELLYGCFLHKEVLHHFIRRVYLKYHYHHKYDHIIRLSSLYSLTTYDNCQVSFVRYKASL